MRNLAKRAKFVHDSQMISYRLTVLKRSAAPATGVGIDAFAGMKRERASSSIPFSALSLIRIIQGR
jgi:hypothetical protein